MSGVALTSGELHKRLYLILIVLIGSTLGGCSPAAPEPLELASTLASAPPVIYLMPILDRRAIERSEHILVTQQIEDATTSILGEKGYRIRVAELSAEQRVRVAADARTTELDAEQLVAIGPAPAKRLLVVYVDLIDSEYNSPTLDFRVKVSALLIDTTVPTVVWRGAAEGNSNLAGVFSVLSQSAARYEAIYRSLTNLLVSLPTEDSHA